jgi:fermentation-respiration switch protein FrsA (DUF1100 family)
VIIGPMTYVKEQAPTEYATRLAERGFAALAFDCRYRGESGGEPRALENPIHKVEDIQAAVDFISSLEEVDAQRIAGLGICQGSSEMIRAVAGDSRIRVGATVAGHYRDHEGDLAWLTEAGYQERLSAGKKALSEFQRSGEVAYIPGVDKVDPRVGMPGELVWSWYAGWAERGVWENFYAVQSDAVLLTYESITAARTIDKPYLMIHSDQCMLPDAAKRHFEAIPSQSKKLSWKGQTPHLSFYDQADVVGATVNEIDEFLQAHLV